MSAPNFHAECEKILSSLDSAKKPRLLLHACCAPCSSYTIEFLAEHFFITIFYYNPNIFPAEEYFRRLNELKSFLTKFPPALKNRVEFHEENYDEKEFFDAIKIRENPELKNSPEKGERCRRCYKFRLEKSFEFAAKNDFDFFCTTLSISPFKDAKKINETGMEIAQKNPCRTKWLFSDFKKKNGFKRSLELSAEFGLYRQNYCGCIFSAESSTTRGQQASTAEQL